ncbi:hypothetical protein B484DRAFT_452588 [Ochromonadaceae sp. CCMP2298]|nr:hypothetical protein B484DRAFT_452588 [Ochromonadaceae sp. CCMP2298]|mmetsp:Transcript_7051/g.15421  ORF Transcript_7051/g.15421 Transcript_7051/m.15421 type:complete len:421 (-) Transcript_7051:293-1555(-)|eukprot:CAMPEP_0173296140 /NCGR_PEP_ID=MMETSP1143-20121109/14789_1 /TAXON_ID=483371 /ORGANISM="non described non described, Strain CCMP2298" /LENGTH=420 /DNA_ID=CAMNT_0014235947 /DNA_START=32 /DNA_END=1294 /DNA_ORIENTATION=-
MLINQSCRRALVALLVLAIASGFRHLTAFNGFRSDLRMSTVLQFDDRGRDYNYGSSAPAYKSAPTSTRALMGTKLTSNNKKYMDVGLKFRSQYTKMRLLTEEEEMTAGKFSSVGQRLDRIKTFVESRLGRSVTDDEWAAACKLSTEELREYVKMAAASRTRLVQHNIRLVDYWARRLIEFSAGGKEVSYYELVTEGVIGLTKAAEKYDGRGRFVKYAVPYIMHELYKGMTTLREGSFLSHKNMMLCYRAFRAQAKLYETLQRNPTDQEVASSLGVSASRLRGVMDDARTKKKVVSAQTQLGGNDENLVTYLDLFLNAAQNSGEINSEKTVWQAEFQSALECLSPIERRTLSLRYGLFPGCVPRSIEHTAELMCSSPEGVRKIILRAMEKLRSDPRASVLQQGPPLQAVETTNGRTSVMAY